MAMPAVVLMLGMVLATMSWAHLHMTAQHAATTAARVALTHDDSVAVGAARSIAGGGAHVSIERQHPWITVVVTLTPDGPWPDVTAEARAHAP